TLMIAILGRVLMGIGASFAVVGCLKIASIWFPPRRFALVAGLTVAIGMLGAAGGQAPMAVLVNQLGWRETLLYGSLLGLALAAVLWRAMKPAPGVSEVTVDDHPHIPLAQALKTISFDKQTWLASLYAGLMFVPTVGFAGLWGVPYLMQAYALTRPEAALYISLIYVGWAIGGPIFGWYSDSIARRRRPMVVATFGTLFAMQAIWMLPDSLMVMGFLLLLLGIFSSGFVLAFSVVRESHSERLTGAAMGFVNTLNSLSGAISQPILGLILDYYWIQGTYVDGARSYSLDAYHSALFSIPVCLVISLLILPFIHETYCKARAD
ncbi:MAG: MFS transporter, partial [Pseudomonadota bacterium]